MPAPQETFSKFGRFSRVGMRSDETRDFRPMPTRETS